MTPDRYAKDYILDEKTDESGQVSFQYNYHGPVYVLEADRGLIRRVLLLSAAAWVLFVAAMIPRSHAMHAWYVSVPFVFTAIPLWLMAGVVLFLKKHEREQNGKVQGEESGVTPDQARLKRKEADLINNTWPAAAGSVFVLPAISVIGQVTCLIRGVWLMPGDAVFTLAAAVLSAVGLVLFKGRLTAEPVNSEVMK